MKKYIFFILFVFCSTLLFAQNRSINLSLRQAIDLSLRKNPDLKLISLRIKKTELDIKQKFIDIKETKLKQKRKRLAFFQLENQREDIIDTVYYDVQSKYYNCLLAKIRYNKSKLDLNYLKNYLKESNTNYQDGKIDKITYERIKEEFKQKEEELVLSRGEYKRSLLYFLLSINESLSLYVNFTDSISENIKSIQFKSAQKILLKQNRTIRFAMLNFQVKKLEYDLLDRKIMSKNDLKRAELDLNESKIQLEQAIRKQKVELWSRYLLIREQEARFITFKKRMDRGKQAHYLDERRYLEGYISKITLDRSHIVYKNLNLQYLRAIKEYNLAKLRFFFLLN